MSPRHPPSVLSAAELRAFLRVPNPATTSGLRHRAIIQLLADGGLGIREVAELTTADLEWAEGQPVALRVQGDGAARDGARVLPLSRAGSHYLARWLARRAELGVPGERMFCVFRRGRAEGHFSRERKPLEPGGPLSERYLGAMVARTGREAGLQRPVTATTLQATARSREVQRQRLALGERLAGADYKALGARERAALREEVAAALRQPALVGACPDDLLPAVLELRLASPVRRRGGGQPPLTVEVSACGRLLAVVSAEAASVTRAEALATVLDLLADRYPQVDFSMAATADLGRREAHLTVALPGLSVAPRVGDLVNGRIRLSVRRDWSGVVTVSLDLDLVHVWCTNGATHAEEEHLVVSGHSREGLAAALVARWDHLTRRAPGYLQNLADLTRQTVGPSVVVPTNPDRWLAVLAGEFDLDCATVGRIRRNLREQLGSRALTGARTRTSPQSSTVVAPVKWLARSHPWRRRSRRAPAAPAAPAPGVRPSMNCWRHCCNWRR